LLFKSSQIPLNVGQTGQAESEGHVWQDATKKAESFTLVSTEIINQKLKSAVGT